MHAGHNFFLFIIFELDILFKGNSTKVPQPNNVGNVN